MLYLYHGDSSVCSQKVRLALAEKGVQWTGELLNLGKGDQFRPDYVKLNPNAVVPTIRHGDHVIIESTVINEYVDDAFDGPPLKPATPYGRAVMRLWTKIPDEGIHVDVNTLSYAIYLRLPVLKLPPDQQAARIDGIPDPVRREKMREMVTRGVDSPLVDGALQRFDRLFAQMEKRLAVSPWLAGDTYSLADAGLTAYVHRLDLLGLTPMWSRARPALTTWFNRIRERPSFKLAIVDFEPQEKVDGMRDAGRQCASKLEAKLAAL